MTVICRRKSGLTNLTHKLTFGTIILVQIDFRSITARTFAVIIDIAFGATIDGLDGFVIILVTPCIVSHEISVIPRLYIPDQREFINLKLLIFWRM